MADEAKPAEATDEVDVVRAAIWFFGILIVGLGVVYAFLLNQRDAHRTAIQYGEKNLKGMASQYDQIQALLKQYKESGAEEARVTPRTWLKARYQAAGLQDGQVATEKWSERPQKDYSEWYLEVVLKNVRRDQAVHFLWNVEKVSPKMRTIEMKMDRRAPPTAPETDNWDLRVSFGYRVPRGVRTGS